MSNVETMFDANNRPMPWENLGEKIFGALNSKDAIKAAKLDWFVYPMPVYSEICYPGRDPFKRKMKIAENFVANVRDIDDEILGIVSPKYKIIQNTEAFAFTDELLGNHNIVYETAGSIDGGKRIWLLARIPAMFKIFDDDIDPYIVFTNTHDGSGAVKVIMTPVRVVCKNTLNLALQTAKRCWSASHIGNVKEKMIMARETLFNAKNYMDYLILSAKKLYKIKLATEKVEAIIDALLPIRKDGKKEHIVNTERRRKDLMNRFKNAPDLQNYKGTGYALINAVSDYASHQPFYEAFTKGNIKKNTSIQNLRERNFVRNIDGMELLDKAYKKILEYA